jgi:hypothetical protein
LIIEYFAAFLLHALVLSSFPGFSIDLRHPEIGTEIPTPLSTSIFLVIVLSIEDAFGIIILRYSLLRGRSGHCFR